MFRGLSSLLGLFFLTAGVVAVASPDENPRPAAARRPATPTVPRPAADTSRWRPPPSTRGSR